MAKDGVREREKVGGGYDGALLGCESNAQNLTTAFIGYVTD